MRGVIIFLLITYSISSNVYGYRRYMGYEIDDFKTEMRNLNNRNELSRSTGNTLLHCAIRYDQPDKVDALIAFQSAKNVVKKPVDAVKSFFTGEEHVSAVNINAKNIDEVTPLMYAVILDKTNIIKKLIDHGADPNIHSSSPKGVMTPVMFAASKDNVQITKYFIEGSFFSKLNPFDKKAKLEEKINFRGDRLNAYGIAARCNAPNTTQYLEQIYKGLDIATVEKAYEKVKQAEKEKEQLQNQYNKERQESQKLQSQNDALQTEKERLQNQYAKEQQELQKLQSQNDALQAERERLQNQYAKEQQELQKLQSQNDALYEKARRTEEYTDSLHHQYAKERRELQNENDALWAEKERLQNQNNQQSSVYNSYQQPSINDPYNEYRSAIIYIISCGELLSGGEPSNDDYYCAIELLNSDPNAIENLEKIYKELSEYSDYLDYPYIGYYKDTYSSIEQYTVDKINQALSFLEERDELYNYNLNMLNIRYRKLQENQNNQQSSVYNSYQQPSINDPYNEYRSAIIYIISCGELLSGGEPSNDDYYCAIELLNSDPNAIENLEKIYKELSEYSDYLDYPYIGYYKDTYSSIEQYTVDEANRILSDLKDRDELYNYNLNMLKIRYTPPKVYYY